MVLAKGDGLGAGESVGGSAGLGGHERNHLLSYRLACQYVGTLNPTQHTGNANHHRLLKGAAECLHLHLIVNRLLANRSALECCGLYVVSATILHILTDK